jgi:AcrR family transcriptional regulator
MVLSSTTMSSSRSTASPVRAARPRRQEVRRRLLDAAAEVFAAQGYDGSSVEDIARRAGLTKGAVYSNFESKEALFFELLEEHISGRIALIEAFPAKDAPVADWVRAIGDGLMTAITEHPDWHLLFIEFWQRAMRDPDARERFIAQRRHLRRLISAAIRERSTELHLRPPLDPDDLATIVLALSNGLAIEYLLDPKAVPRSLFGEALLGLARIVTPASGDQMPASPSPTRTTDR